jgi:hypothetical protein
VNKIVVLALCVLLPGGALAQQPTGGGASAPPAPAPAASLPLDAYLHHQPTEPDVIERERQRYGAATVGQENRREQSEIDQLYDEVIRRSAPDAASGATAPPPR